MVIDILCSISISPAHIISYISYLKILVIIIFYSNLTLPTSSIATDAWNPLSQPYLLPASTQEPTISQPVPTAHLSPPSTSRSLRLHGRLHARVAASTLEASAAAIGLGPSLAAWSSPAREGSWRRRARQGPPRRIELRRAPPARDWARCSAIARQGEVNGGLGLAELELLAA